MYSPEGGLVLDPFLGSGSTGIAAIQEGRNFTGIDMTQHYVDIAERRIQDHCFTQEPAEQQPVDSLFEFGK